MINVIRNNFIYHLVYIALNNTINTNRLKPDDVITPLLIIRKNCTQFLTIETANQKHRTYENNYFYAYFFF
ncbi:MAG TPA: hypothetical protein PLA68_16030, partial [Panacibacter sp.]|nr:hypothetical protein [Panacibacter sp.]